jgi:hypothetical protein
MTENGVLYDVVQTLLRRSLLHKCQTVSQYASKCNLIYARKKSSASPANIFSEFLSPQRHKLMFFIHRNVDSSGVSLFMPSRQERL